MANVPLAVILAGKVIGEVERTRPGTLRLTYTDDGRAPGSTPLSLSLPTDRKTIAGQKVETFLQALLPDSNAAVGAIARRYGADPRDSLSLLAAVGKDCAGAVQLCRPDEVEETIARKGHLVPLSDGEIELRLAELGMDAEASWTMPGEHWSLGGSQQKFALRRIEDEFFEAQGAQPTSHIIKPGVYGLKAQALIEHVSMRAAEACGVEMAQTEFQSFKSENAIVVTRFDRAPDTDGNLYRLHQEDLCQALGRSEKYESSGGPSASDLIRLLRDSADTAAEARSNVDKFVDGLIYNTVVAAPDAHARNYAVLLDGDHVRLAPLFDVASGLAYTSAANSRQLSMSIANMFHAEQVTLDHWKRFAEHNRLDEADVLYRVLEMADRMPDALQDALDEIDDWDGTASELRGRLIPAAQARASSIASQG